MHAPPQKLPLPKVNNLLTDRKQERDVGAYNSWVADPAVRIIHELGASFNQARHSGPLHAPATARFPVATACADTGKSAGTKRAA
jgi:hypothetical protein